MQIVNLMTPDPITIRSARHVVEGEERLMDAGTLQAIAGDG